MKRGWTVPSGTSALESELHVCSRSPLLKLCPLKHGLKACSTAATLVLRKTEELLGRFW